MSASVRVNVEGLLPLKQQIELMTMPKSLRRRLLNRTAKAVIRDSKQRVRKQVDLDGKPFKKRAKKRKGSQRMLNKLVKELRVTSLTGTHAVVGFYRSSSSQIAAKHQYGSVETITAKQFQHNDKGGHEGPATRRQAIALREAGFKIKSGNGKRLKAPSLKWVVANMKQGQAGAALRYLREKAGQSIQQSWQTTLPARSFLGASKAQVKQHTQTIFNQMKQEITYGRR